jgi:methionyl-tRNA formyltransferase
MGAETQTYSIIFVGLDCKVLDLLLKSNKFKVVGVNLIKDFIEYKTFNINNLFFKVLYCLKFLDKFNITQLVLLKFYKILYRLGSRLFVVYAPYLFNLYKHKIKIIDFNDIKKTVDFINTQNIDLVVVSNWWLLPDEIIHAPKFKTINIHPSKLPKYRGSVPTLWALKHRDKETAVTFMVLNSVVDGGDIIAQHNVPISPTDDSIILENKCDRAIRKFLICDLNKYLKKKINLTKQNIKLGSVTPKYYEYMKVAWENELAQDIVNKIKLYPHLWPLDMCYAIYQGEQVFFKGASLLVKSSESLSGTFAVKKLKLYVNGVDDTVVFQLFRDITLRDSLVFLFKRNGIFSSN